MTGNQIKGKGFRGALRYNLEKVSKGTAEVLDHTFVNATEKAILKEIQMVRIQRPNLQKYFYHTSINFPPSEDLPNDTMKQIAHDYLKANGFDQHQFIMFRHHDADHPHLHILVNRIGYNGKVLSDSNDYARSEKVLRELEEKYNLTKVKSSREATERAMTKDELEMMKRTNEPSQKMKLQVIIRNVLQGKAHMTTQQFIDALHERQINVLFNQASTGFVSGVSYEYQGMIIKGAKLGSDFKWPSIKNNIDYEQERDSTAIYQANARAKSGRGAGESLVVDKGDSSNAQKHRARHQDTFTANKNSQFNPAGHQNNDDQGQFPGRATGSKNKVHDLQFSETPPKFDLAKLLDGYSHGNSSELDHEPHLDNVGVNPFKKRKKKRKYRRL